MATATTRKKPESEIASLPPINIASARGKNVGKLQEVHLKLGGHSLVVSGSNKEGKSTTLRMIQIGLGQMGSKDMPESVRKGEDSAWTDLDIAHAETGEILFNCHRECELNEWAPIVVRDAKTGEKKRRPQEFMDSFIDRTCIRPFDWLDQRPVDQVDSVLRICRVPIPVDEIERITGERHEVIGDETVAQYLFRLSADKTGKYFVDRTIAGREWEQKKKSLRDQREKLDALPEIPASDGADLAELMKQRDDLDSKRERRRALERKRDDRLAVLRRERDEAKSFLEDNEATMAALPDQLKAATQKANDTEAEIARLRKRLEQEVADIQAITLRIQNGQGTLTENRAELQTAEKALADETKKLQASVDALPDPTRQIEELTGKIATIDGRRQEIAKRKAMDDLFEQLRQEEADAKADYDKIDMKLTGLRDLRLHLLDNVDLGVPGLQIGDGELRLNDVPFKEQASSAEQGIVAYTLAKLRNPHARFMFADNSEKFDAMTRATILQCAERDNIQLFLAVVRDDLCDECGGREPHCEKCGGTGRVNAPLDFKIMA